MTVVFHSHRVGRRGLTAALVALALTLTSPTYAAPTSDAITVPSGSPAELLAFIEQVKRTPPAENDVAAVQAHLVRIENAIVTAAEKITSAEPNEAERSAAVSEKLKALMLLRRLDAVDAEARWKSYLDEVARDPHPYVPPLGKIYSLATRLQEVDRGNHVELEKLTADVRAHVKSARLDEMNLSIAYQTALADEQAGLDKLAVEAYREFAAAFAKSDDPRTAENAKKLEGAARLLTLAGEPLPLEGTLLTGEKFDPKTTAGKTTLVVFFSTHSGPSMAELPLLKEASARYADRGFTVVLVSVDADRRRLEDLVKREELPWPVLFAEADAPLDWSHPLALHYGVMRLPRSILLDKEGRVTSIDAHGDYLWDLLAQAIGPAIVKEEPADKPADEKSPADKPVP